jgi:hypothetical protein
MTSSQGEEYTGNAPLPEVPCTCHVDPYQCPRGQALVEDILKRKKQETLDELSELGSDEKPFRKLGKNVRTATGQRTTGSGRLPDS